MVKIKIDGIEYDTSNASSEVYEQLQNIQFVDRQILQLNNELQIAETAKIGYLAALKREVG